MSLKVLIHFPKIHVSVIIMKFLILTYPFPLNFLITVIMNFFIIIMIIIKFIILTQLFPLNFLITIIINFFAIIISFNLKLEFLFTVLVLIQLIY